MFFSASENIEDQNYQMDTFEIQFSYIPPIFCSEQTDDGSFLNTGFYFLKYNFDPIFTPLITNYKVQINYKMIFFIFFIIYVNA